jgi:hypothetical protein
VTLLSKILFWECKWWLSRWWKFSILYAALKFVTLFARTRSVVWKTYKQLVPEVKEEMYLRTCVFILLGIYIRRRKVSFPCLFIPRSYTHQTEQLVYQSPKGLKKRRDLKKWNTRISAKEIIIYTGKVSNNRADSRHTLQTGTVCRLSLHKHLSTLKNEAPEATS